MMKKWILALCAIFLFAPFASAQFTNVTANPVQDPSGSPYVGCRAEADFVPAPTATTQPLINGSVFPTSVVLSQCDSFGNASWTLVDNNQVSDGHSGAASQWRFSITSQDGKTGFFCPITVTGASQNITAALQACAAPLPPTGGGGGNLVVKTLPCASSMIFTMAGVSPNTSNTSFFINPLNCNVTSSVVAPPTGGVLQKGAIAQFTFINDNVGGHSFAWPSNFLDQPSIQGGASPANCSTNTPPNCVTTNASFWYDGTQWHAQTFPAAGGGGGNPAGNQGTIQSTNGTSFSASNLSEPPNGTLAGAFKVNEDTGFLGPNPYVDIRAFGASPCNPNATPCKPGITATTNGTTTVTLSAASTFLNGNGVTIYGVGPAITMSTPSAPTVTPSNAAFGTGTGIVVNAPTGATTFNYKVLACDIGGGCTAASSTGSTTTGNTLGAQSLSVTSITRANDVLTFNTPSQPNLSVGTQVHVDGCSVADGALGFCGMFNVSTVTATGFTVAGTGLDTRNGAATASSGGATANWFACNHVTWSAVTGTFRYVVQSDRQSPGTFVNIGMSFPVDGGFTDGTLFFDDFGQTMMARSASAIPAYVPTNGSATADNLTTTIVSGAGTTTLVLANSASQTLSGKTILLDNAPNIIAANNSVLGGAIEFPFPASGTAWVTNSIMNVTTNVQNQWMLPAGAIFNDTVVWNSNATFGIQWYGDRLPGGGSGASFQPKSVAQIFFGSTPGLFVANGGGGGGEVRSLQLAGAPNGIAVLVDGGGGNVGGTWDQVNFLGASTSTDYMSMGFVCRGVSGSSSCVARLGTALISAGSQAMTDSSFTPSAWWDDVGDITINILAGSARSMYVRGDPAGSQFRVGSYHWQGGAGPFVSVNSPGTGLGVIIGDAGAALIDTGSNAAVFNGGINPHPIFVTCGVNGCGSPIAGVLQFTGASMFVNNGSGFGIAGQNRNSITPKFGQVNDGIFSAFSNPPVNYLENYLNGSAAVGPSYKFFVDSPPMAAPATAVVGGGSVPVGAQLYSIAPVWMDNSIGNVSPTASATTTTGNQQVNLTWTPATGCKGYLIYRNAIGLSGGVATVTGCNTSTYSDTAAAPSGSGAPPFAGGGPTMLMPGNQGMVAPQWTLTGGFASVHTGSFTANRTVTWPDASGTVALSATSPITLSAAGAVACPNCFNLSTSNNIGANFFDIGTRAGPGNPASGNIRLYADSTSGNLTCLTSVGANCIPGGGGGTPGGSTTQVQINIAGAFAGSANMTYVSPTLTMGVNAATTGQLALANGGTSGVSVTVQNNAATTAYNFNLPSGAGSFGQPLISGGGGSAAMTFGTLGFSGGGTNQTTFTANQLVTDTSGSLASVAGSTTGTNPILKLQPSSAANTALILDTAATPTGDIQDWNINGTKTSWMDSSAFLHVPQVTFNSPTSTLDMSGANGTCPSALGGTGIICLNDSTTSMALLSNNGGNFKPIAQFSNAGPAAHGVGLASITAPQINFSSAGITGQAFVSGGASADGAYGPLNLAGGTNIFTGQLPPAAGGTGASSIAGANIVTVTGAITAGHCTSWNASTVVQDSGAACGGGSSPARLDQITAGTATNTINSTTFAQTWNWALTGSTTAFKLGENTPATGTNNILVQATTASASTAVPFQTDNNGNGYQLSSSGLWKPVGTGALATPGSAHNLVASQGSSSAVTYIPPVAAGKVLIDNGPGNDPSFQDPIVSQAFVNLWTAQDITATRTSANVRNPIFSQTATLQLTFAGITGSPATCTLQFRGVDSQGNVLNNGGTVSISPANGTTSQTFTAASTLQTAAQVSAVYACGTYPTAGTLTLDFTPIPNVNVTNIVSAADNVTQFGGTNISTGTGASGAGIPRVTISNDSSLAANQSVNVNQIGGSAVSTAATGVQKVGITGNAGAAMDAAGQNVAQPANELLTGCAFNTTPTTVTSGNMTQSQCDNKGNLLVNLNTSIPAGTNVIGALSANQSINVAQVNGNTTSTAASGVQKVGVVGNAGVAVDAATGAAPPANAVFIGGLKSGATGGFVTGITACDLDFNINISTATTTLAVTGVSGRQVRICSIHMVNNAADNVALIEGTGATCGTGTAGMAGGTTAASGYNFPANGGLTLGSGIGEVITTATTGDSVCIVTSAATQLSGHIKYTIY